MLHLVFWNILALCRNPKIYSHIGKSRTSAHHISTSSYRRNEHDGTAETGRSEILGNDNIPRPSKAVVLNFFCHAPLWRKRKEVKTKF